MIEFDERPSFNLETKTVIINDKEVRYLESQGIHSTHNPLVMIPGWPVSAHSLKPLMQELGEDVKCYALNLPGFGGSETDYGTNHSFSYYAKFLGQFHERIVGSEKVNLLGYSTGGVLGIVYDNEFQNALDKLIVFSSPYNGIEYYQQASEKGIRYFSLFVLLKRYRPLTRLLNNRLVIGRIVKTVISDIYSGGYPGLFHTGGRFTKELIEESSKFNVKAVIDLAADLSGHDFSDKAKRVRAPTLVIAAENDEVVTPDMVRPLSELIPGSQYVLIPGADHSVGLAEPDKMARLIVEFLRGQE